MIEAGQGAGLGQVGVERLAVVEELAARHLDGHLAMELFVAAQVNFAEAALAEELFHLVAAEVGWGLFGRRRLRGSGEARAVRCGLEGVGLFFQGVHLQ